MQTLASLPAGLPREFRLFKAGVNETAKGTFIFDATAAASVMAAYRRNGTDLMVDVDHASLGPATRADSYDARGWFKLALRGGELWAVDVTWTPDGARRLKEKCQRYISPAFTHDQSGRVKELVNAAIVAMPATYDAPALVAAGRYGARTSAMVSARVPLDQFRALRATAERMGLPVGQYIRACLASALLPGKAKDAEAIFKRVAIDMGLPGDTPPEDLVAALTQMLASLAAPSEAPSGEAAQETASRLSNAPAAPQLSAHARELAAKMNPEQRARFIASLRERDAHQAQLRQSREAEKKRIDSFYKSRQAK